MNRPSQDALDWWAQWGEQIIYGAVDRGRAKYFADNRRQEEAFREWEKSGYEGDCRQCTNGSLVDYITRSVLAIAETSPPLTHGEASEVVTDCSADEANSTLR